MTAKGTRVGKQTKHDIVLLFSSYCFMYYVVTLLLHIRIKQLNFYNLAKHIGNIRIVFKGQTAGCQPICYQEDYCSGDVGHRFVDGQRKPIEVHLTSGRKTRVLQASVGADRYFYILTSEYKTSSLVCILQSICTIRIDTYIGASVIKKLFFVRFLQPAVYCCNSQSTTMI